MCRMCLSSCSLGCFLVVFFFSSRRRHTRFDCDWSSDVCSSDLVYVVSGLTAGIAALLAIGYYGSASSGDGSGYELDVIASAVVGGASLSGGKGSALGALLGALIIKMIDNGIVILGIDQSYSRIIIGAVVILAVTLDQFNTWLAKRRLTKTV